METEVEYFHFCHGFRFNFAVANYHQKKKIYDIQNVMELYLSFPFLLRIRFSKYKTI